ncbi:MAG: septal ring lytic transglycosylase RlpA family protein [Pseudomonadota bacterium]
MWQCARDNWKSGARLLAVASLAAVVAGCTSSTKTVTTSRADINDKTKFSSAAYGVAASPRLTKSKRVKRGGGFVSLGKPYKIRGKWYTPKEATGYVRTGTASWYGPNFHGRLTANGEIYDQYSLSAAHPTFPLPSYARVTNTKNGHSAIVRVNDRGPYAHNRLIDLSSRTADVLDFKQAGTAKVKVEYIGRAPLDAKDVPYLEASIRVPGVRSPGRLPGQLPGIGTDPVVEPTVMVAAAPTRNRLVPGGLNVPRPGAGIASPGRVGTTGSVKASNKRLSGAAPQADRVAPRAPEPATGEPMRLPGFKTDDLAVGYRSTRVSHAHSAPQAAVEAISALLKLN